jgi:hypothetical protein
VAVSFIGVGMLEYPEVGTAVKGKRFTVCTEITIILGTVRVTIRGGRLRYKRYDATFLKKSSVELPFSSFGDHLINILRKVNFGTYGESFPLYCSTNFISIMSNSLATSVTPTVKIKSHLINRSGPLIRKVILRCTRYNIV